MSLAEEVHSALDIDGDGKVSAKEVVEAVLKIEKELAAKRVSYLINVVFIVVVWEIIQFVVKMILFK